MDDTINEILSYLKKKDRSDVRESATKIILGLCADANIKVGIYFCAKELPVWF